MDKRAHILVIDGQEIEGDELRYLLEGEGYAVDRAASGTEALSKIEQERFDLVLAEIPVPDMDGPELIRDIREADHNVVEIVMGDHLSLEAAIEAWNCEISGYVPQPLNDPDEVLAAVSGGLADRKPALVSPGIVSQR
ncbi:MAG: response regulator [Anaerolineae bacterium]|nr:response regulator [Anaerolineae bacterium]